MEYSQPDHYFLPGKVHKKGFGIPGLLVIENQYRFRYNHVSKDNSVFKMYCDQHAHPEHKCKAKATVKRREDDSFLLVHCDSIHTHFVNKSAIKAQELRQRMVEIVKNDPAAPVGDAIKAVKIEAANEYRNDDDEFNEIIDALGTHHALELKLLRVRDNIIGPMPRSRDWFDPFHFLNKVFKDNNKVEILDSNKLPDNWEELIRRENPHSNYHWDRLNDDMLSHEDEENTTENPEDDDNEIHSTIVDLTHIIDCPEDPPPVSKNLPKRVLAFSSLNLLKLFSKCERSSVDGTFKTCCKLWKQQFVWMVKKDGHWIPVVFGWLPDKSETSYKVIC